MRLTRNRIALLALFVAIIGLWWTIARASISFHMFTLVFSGGGVFEWYFVVLSSDITTSTMLYQIKSCFTDTLWQSEKLTQRLIKLYISDRYAMHACMRARIHF